MKRECGGDGGSREGDRGEGGGAAEEEDGGAAVQRRRLGDGGVAVTMVKYPWPGQGVAVVVAAAAAAVRRRAAAAAAAMAVGLLPRPSLSSHLRGRALLSFFK